MSDLEWRWAGAPGSDICFLVEVWERSQSGSWSLALVDRPPDLNPFEVPSTLASAKATWVPWKAGTTYRWRIKAYSKTGAGQSDYSEYLYFQTP